jgi:hypothetical protein
MSPRHFPDQGGAYSLSEKRLTLPEMRAPQGGSVLSACVWSCAARCMAIVRCGRPGLILGSYARRRREVSPRAPFGRVRVIPCHLTLAGRITQQRRFSIRPLIVDDRMPRPGRRAHALRTEFQPRGNCIEHPLAERSIHGIEVVIVPVWFAVVPRCA